MTDYNIDFLIAGLVFLIFLLIHFQRYKKLNNISGRTFWFLIIAGIFDIIFDLLSSILLVKSNPAYNSWMIFFSTMLYILQMIVVYIFYNYTQKILIKFFIRIFLFHSNTASTFTIIKTITTITWDTLWLMACF